METGHIAFTLYVGVVVFCLFKFISHRIDRAARQKRLSREHDCQPIHVKYPHKDPILGIDIFIRNVKAVSKHNFLETVTKRHEEVGETYQLNMLGTVGIMTRDEEIIKTVLSTRFKDYNLHEERKKALNPLLGQGIFSSDGLSWAHSRSLLRPQFARSQLMDLSMLESHVSCLMSLIPNGKEIELQELLLRFTMDMATDFLFGESTNSLLADRDGYHSKLDGFAESVQYAQDRIAIHMALGKWALLKPDPKFKHHVRVVHKFVDELVHKALHGNDPDTKTQPYILLRALVEDTQDPIRIRDEVINILIAGRDTTASLISNVFFLLSKRPGLWSMLRNEVLTQFKDQPPAFEDIPQCKYIRYTINESLRLFPPVPVNSRVANCDTVLPRGGGVDGKSPLFIPKGTPVIYNVFGLHRRQDVYGSDVEEFKPSRWESLRLSWEFLPFNGGPRICIGQQFALIEASYVLIRFLQCFETVESKDERPWQEKIALTVSNRNGVRVSFTRT
ncbi:cytochrome P450 [Trichoderma citrinoviride]|uniref:Cytochrome P450 n=1 Tax=Trichoderma citrinoviride TaxID=58853 RepID=A0A2T4B1N0_9HYPO|nr:cytochrome P450 [Trichoderma citrinoviride]PTB63214.1 cytochrome P450 [Trichoderma citrinoviride]